MRSRDGVSCFTCVYGLVVGDGVNRVRISVVNRWSMSKGMGQQAGNVF